MTLIESISRSVSHFAARILRLRPSDEIATRDRALRDGWGGIGTITNRDELYSKTPTAKELNNVLADAQVCGIYAARKSRTEALEWEIDRGKAKSRQAKYVQAVFETLAVKRIVSELLDAPLWGFMPVEVLWQQSGGVIGSTGKAGIVPVRVAAKPPEWFGFDECNRLMFKPLGNVNGEPVRAAEGDDKDTESPKRRFLLAQHNATYINPYGESLLRRIYWAWYIKKEILKMWAAGTERFGSPSIVAKHSIQDAEKLRAFYDLLKAYRSNGIYMIPDTTSIEPMTTDSEGFANAYNTILGYCKTEIEVALLGQAMSTEHRGTGSYAAAKSGVEVSGYLAENDRALIEGVMNELVRWVVELNFGEQAVYPKFLLYERDYVDMEKASFVKTMSESGVRFSKRWLAEEFGYNEDDIQIAGESAEDENDGIESAPVTSGSASETQTEAQDETGIDENDTDADSPAQFSEQGDLTALLNAYDALRKKSSPEAL